MLNNKIITKYEEGILTLYGVYEECDTDLEMYQFIAEHVSSKKCEIKEYMLEVSGANDAYYNALSEMEYEEDEDEEEFWEDEEEEYW